MTTTRPDFQSAAAYVVHVGECLARGVAPWDPSTVGELVAAVEAFPDQAHRWRPAPDECVRMGLPRSFGRRPKPYGDEYPARHLATLAAHRTFAQASVVLHREAVNS